MEEGRCVICWDKKGYNLDCGCTALYCQECCDKISKCGICRRELKEKMKRLQEYCDLKSLYEISFELKGFERLERLNRLEEGEIIVLNGLLSPGDKKEIVSHLLAFMGFR